MGNVNKVKRRQQILQKKRKYDLMNIYIKNLQDQQFRIIRQTDQIKKEIKLNKQFLLTRIPKEEMKKEKEKVEMKKEKEKEEMKKEKDERFKQKQELYYIQQDSSNILFYDVDLKTRTIIISQPQTQRQFNQNQLISYNNQQQLQKQENVKQQKQMTQSDEQQQQLQKKSQVVLDFLNCHICFQKFNHTNKRPNIICKNQHNSCLKCFNTLHQLKQHKCSLCRQYFYQTPQPNKILLKFLTSVAFQQNSLNDQNQHLSSKWQKLKLTLNNVSLKKCLVFHSKQSTIFRFKQDYIRELDKQLFYQIIQFNEIIPQYGKYKFSFDIVNPSKNQVYICLDKYQNKIQNSHTLLSQESITYAPDSGYTRKFTNPDQIKPKKVIQSIVVQKKYKLILQVDMDENLVRWKIGGQIYAQSILSNNLKYKKPFIYLLIGNITQDLAITVNSW